MSLISVKRLDSSKRPIQLVAGDNHDVLRTMERAGCIKGDIYRNGEYLMSAWQAETGVWSLFCRVEAAPTIPAQQVLKGVRF